LIEGQEYISSGPSTDRKGAKTMSKDIKKQDDVEKTASEEVTAENLKDVVGGSNYNEAQTTLSSIQKAAHDTNATIIGKM
jgi:hypothetical protein